MFDSLTDRLQGVMQSLKGHGKLTAEDIPLIRELRKQGLSLRAVARQFDVSVKTICNIEKGVIWRDA